MKIEKEELILDDHDYKEIFSLFSSPTKEEVNQIYDASGMHYFEDSDLEEIYTLSQERREFAIDAWRAVMMFLRTKQVSISYEGKDINFSFIENLYC